MDRLPHREIRSHWDRLLGSLTVVPGLLLFLEQALLADGSFLKENYWLPFSIIAYSVLLILSASLLMLLFSSLTSNPRYATIGFCAIWFGSPVIQQLLRLITRTSKTAVVSIWANYDILGSVLFDSSHNHAVHWVFSEISIPTSPIPSAMLIASDSHFWRFWVNRHRSEEQRALPVFI